MTRAHLKSLILLNWKGLFYHRFDLHERVTALEGENGAGKTTVMIAAYVALLPDLTKLRFTNVGEHGSTGGDRGIYGRLGEPGCPTYTVLDVGLPDGARLLCGVQLVRKSAPSLELTPFLISGLSWQISPQDVLLERSDVDAIPQLDGLRQNAARHGGRLASFPSAKEYFTALFDYGITPMRLVSEDEREKFNEVLRTSMVGGISRALGGELRSFLLKEESGLADALKQMRSNLDACRRTRTEVKEAEQIESQIHAVLESGQEMFAAAVHAMRSRAAELRKIWDDMRCTYDAEYAQLEKLKEQAERAEDVHKRAEQACQELKQQREEAAATIGRLRQRCALDQKLEKQRGVCATVREHAARTEEEKRLTAEERERCRKRDQNAREAEAQAAQGLADLRQGMEELERRAVAYRMATEAQTRVSEILGQKAVDLAQLPTLERRCQAELKSLDARIVQMDRRIQTAVQHAAEFARVSAALKRLLESFEEDAVVLSSSPHEQAQRLLRLLRAIDAQVAALPELSTSLQETRNRAREQRTIQSEAAELSSEHLSLVHCADVFAAQQQTEEQQREAEEQLRELRAELQGREEDVERASSRINVLEKEIQAYQQARGLADELSEAWAQPLSYSGDVEALRVRLDEQLRIAERDADTAERELKQLQEEVWSTEQAGCLPETLRRACNQVAGELLVDRFEDVPLEDAGRVQARLGPLYEAILVEDLSAAAMRLTLLDNRQRPETVWLVDGSTDLHDVLEPEADQNLKEDVLIRSPAGTRLTRIPERPVLGARARARRVSELRRREQNQSDRLDELRTTLEQLRLGLSKATGLLRRSGVLDRGDPGGELEETRRAAQRAEEALPGLRSRIAESKSTVQTLGARRKRLLALCERAHLLDLPDQEAAAQALALQIQRAQQLQKQLGRFAAQRQLLEVELETLRVEPLSDAERQQLAEEKSQLEGTRDRNAHLLRDLRHLVENSVALGWGDAEQALARRTVESSTLKAQLEQAQKEREQAGLAKQSADSRHEEAMEAALKARAALESAEHALQKLCEEHESLGGSEQTPEAAAEMLDTQEQRLSELSRMIPEQERSVSKLLEEKAALAERQQSQRTAVDKLSDEVSKAERAARPEQERYERLEMRAKETGVLGSALAERYLNKFTGQGAVNLWGCAREQRALLCERLHGLAEGPELARQVEKLFAAEQSSGEAALDAWLRARSFLLRCIPAQIAEANDPEVALGRLRDHLRKLERNLSQQEERLRGNSQDVAHNIEGLVRKARKQVTRLNQDLGMVRFGSIVGVRIRVVPVEKMERVLRALKEGTVQTLLFQTEMPLEEALEEIFRTYGGGRSGGHKLLDYREYVELIVEICRQVSTDWEPVNATKMSTGEAIGVGAAVMMVILTAWERDANLLRPKRTTGTLRLLFLDEANRLSRDSLDVLFDLCEGLELQLLIAAPEVANAEGNITHRLERVVEQGREEVRVNGRRVVARLKEDGAAVHVA